MTVTTLDLDHIFTRSVGKCRIFIETFLGILVELLKVFECGAPLFATLFEIGDQHPKLCAPVSDMVLSDHLVAEKFQQIGKRIADDR